MSLRLRLAATAGLAVALVAVLLTVGVYAAARSQLRGEVDRALDARSQVFVDEDAPRGLDARRGPGRRRRDAPAPPDVPFGGASGSFQLVSSGGAVSLPAGETATLPVTARTRAIAGRGEGRAFEDATVDDVHLRILTVGLGSRGALQVARPLTEVDASLHRILALLALLGVAGIGLAALLGALVARTALAPVRAFTRRTEALVGDPDISHRLPVQGRDELARLARSFNAALEALERSLEAQRQLVADAGHELRTPISSLRANIQMFEQASDLPAEERAGLRDDILSELDELTGLVGDLVELARGVRGDELVDDVRLDLVTRALVDRFARRTPDVEFRCLLDETIVRGDPERISRAVSNLLDNARKWTPPGGVVEVVVDDGWVTVRDSGPGFEREDLPHVFDRFYRAGTARGKPGSGLGLAIVRQTAESGGGSVAAENAPGGGGLVRVRFDPVSA